MCEQNHIHEEQNEQSSPLLTCYNCDCEIEDGEERNHPDNDWVYCDYCFEERFFSCVCCDTVLSRRYEHTSDDGDSYCESCYYEQYTPCDDCNEETSTDDICSVRGRGVCSCCYENNYTTCDDCGESFSSDDVQYHERDGSYYCSECFPRSVIQSYHYSPTPCYRRTEKENRKPRKHVYFGVELEVCTKQGSDLEDTANDCLDCWTGDHFYAKSDSSINQNGYHGFELVSHPATYAWWNEHREEVSAMLQRLRTDGFESYTTGLCGMHIHVSRKAISPVDQYKLQKLVYENPDMVLKLSCRRKKDLVEWANCYLDESSRCRAPNRSDWITLSKGECADIARYVALNFTDHTIEFRIFRGTLAEKGFWRNLEIVQSMLAYVSTVGINGVSGESYLAYVSSNRKDYPNLYSHIEKKMGTFGFHADETEEE